MNGQLFSAPASNFATRTPIDSPSNIPGYFWSAQYTEDNDRLWYAHGNDVWVYDADTASTTSPAVLGMAVLKGNGSYDSLNDLGYVGAEDNAHRHKKRALRGYRSPLQRSKSPLAVALRAITGGRPEATAKEMAQARAMIGHK
jgi:hypothetical protein